MLFLALALAVAAALAEFTPVPPPRGPYAVGMETQGLMDETRPEDPFVPSSNGTNPRGRRLLVSVFVPVEGPCHRMTVPYMTPLVAADYGDQAAQAGLPTELFSRFGIDVCDTAVWRGAGKSCRARAGRGGSFPVVLFTPGLQDSRLLYGAGARSLASRGFVVVTVDHPLEAAFVEFPDGSVVRGRPEVGSDEAAARELLLEVRAADLSFVLDQLHNRTLTTSLLGPRLSASLDFSRIAVYGHSLGGSAAAALARRDGRVRGGVNLDGQMVGPVARLGLDKPFLLAGRRNHSVEDPTWDRVWPRLGGPRWEVAVEGTAHASFTDRPALVSALGLPLTGPLLRAVEGLIGSVEARRLESIIDDVLVGFFDYAFYGRDGAIGSLAGRYAEVSILRGNM